MVSYIEYWAELAVLRGSQDFFCFNTNTNSFVLFFDIKPSRPTPLLFCHKKFQPHPSIKSAGTQSYVRPAKLLSCLDFTGSNVVVAAVPMQGSKLYGVSPELSVASLQLLFVIVFYAVYRHSLIYAFNLGTPKKMWKQKPCKLRLLCKVTQQGRKKRQN